MVGFSFEHQTGKFIHCYKTDEDARIIQALNYALIFFKQDFQFPAPSLRAHYLSGDVRFRNLLNRGFKSVNYRRVNRAKE